MKKNQRILTTILTFIMIVSFSFCLPGCGKSAVEEEEPSYSEQIEDVEDVTEYGDASLGIDATVDEQLKDYRMILLLGIDNGRRSDLMMVLSINKNTNEIKSVAVHRDTYMQIAEDGTYTIDGIEREFYKCNRAYKRDGIEGAMKELNRHMDLNIRECIAADWAGMAKFLDLMGGIDVYVEEGMLEAINGGNPSDDPDADYKVVEAGQQHLNGWQGVQFMRARRYAGGNAPKREARNQDVMEQLYSKAQSMSLEELIGIYDEMVDDIETNMSSKILANTLAMISESTLEGTEGWPYEYSEMWQNDNSYYYFVCDTLETNVVELHKVLFGQNGYEPSETVKMLNEKLETARKEQLY